MDAWLTLQSNTRNSMFVIENLTLQQRRAFSDEIAPHAFFPHVGLFGKDFVLGAVILKK
jgi:hypothetical protein